MSKYKVLITEKATNDILDIARYISNELLEPIIAQRLLEKFEIAIESLSHMPTRHELVKDKEIVLESIRKIFVDNYIIFYITNEPTLVVTVIRVLYNKRDWINLI